jgi:uncharacterized protein with NRDE domain
VCLLVLAWRAHPRYDLVVAANRDEFHDRPAAPLGPWADAPHLLAGRDLRAGGTWLGVNRGGRFGVVTNYREVVRPRPDAPSRGGLIPAFLAQAEGAGAFLQSLTGETDAFSGFNLLVADEDELWYASNRTDIFARPLPPGIYGLSNHVLDTPWPKLVRVREAFAACLGAPDGPDAARLLALLADRRQVEAHEPLPSTGLESRWERVLSSPFVLNPDYGTRCSTIVMREPGGRLHVVEQRFDPLGEPAGTSEFRLAAGEWPSDSRHRGGRSD